ncbi:heavy metal translocating P-type ATPase [Ignisphaera aggregans DSM 17230]|uniref:Heavy metal translocating P-type ATPase n=1 Tax=Ignisphaera aggregans (strain DSM 17230 / JCM 13409 / AQ1.S1) TaxID=583356 RepID=E0SQ31_IGNAA|nr:heavy metal translocating P-type ATPase [Ignisphaera aggregans DSM 17230]
MVRVSEKIRIIGIDCPSCVYSINSSLAKLKYVYNVRIDINSGDTVVEYDDEYISLREIVRAIRYAGYDVYREYIVLSIDIDEDDVRILEKYLNSYRGVIDYRISPITKILKIAYNPYTISRDEILRYLLSKGYRVSIPKGQEAKIDSGRGRWELFSAITSFSLGLLLIVIHTFKTFGFAIPYFLDNIFIHFILTSIVIGLNIRVFTRGFKGLILLTPSMDSLIALSTGFTYVYSTLVLTGILRGDIFFEASAGVLGFVSIGRYIENRFRARVSEAISNLLEFQRGKVRKVIGDFEEEVEISKISINDIIAIRAGEIIPVDGIVVDGWGYVDESMFTGEPIPIYKSSQRRDPVYAGTILTSGYIKVRATRIGSETLLSQIVEFIREAQTSKPSIQRFADRVVGYLTWLVIAISIATFLYWMYLGGVGIEKAIMFTASVLAVTCPCPLGIAIPMVIAIAIVKAVNIGVMVRASDVFERIEKISMVMFDKTGTLTIGKPIVEEVVFLNNSNSNILAYICSAEKRSEHVYAKAILEYCKENRVESFEPDEYDHFPGLGIIAKINGVEIAIGSHKLLENLEIYIDNNIDEIANKYREKGRAVIFVSMNRKLVALIIVHDKIRDDARELVTFLKNMGIKTAIATGDNRISAKAVAEELGIDLVFSDLRPEDKAKLIDELQDRGERVMYIGDGINDAIALKKAYIGIAMGSGAEVSRQAGDAIIISNKLRSIENLYKLSYAVKRKGLENLFWAFIYNIILIPIAMGILYRPLGIALRPEYAALAMILSDISVVANSLTLFRWKS